MHSPRLADDNASDSNLFGPSLVSTPTHPLHQLYREHHGWLKGWFNQHLGNRSDAADLAQDTFVRVLALRNAETLQQPRAYLRSVARGILIDRFRRKTIEQAYLASLAHHPEAEEISPEQRLLIIELLTRIDQMLDGLGERSRQIFLLSQLEGLSYVDIAQRLELSVTSVKKHMVKAMTQCLLLIED